MSIRPCAWFFGLFLAAPAMADDVVQELLLLKFKVQNQVEAERLRATVVEAVARANEIKETDPDRGLEQLRAAANRVDGVKLLNPGERKAMNEMLQIAIVELRDLSLRKRRVRASTRIDAFRDYLEISGYEGRYPGRSGIDHWEPANFTTPDGISRTGKIVALGTGTVTYKFGEKELHLSSSALPLIQVFGGFYVFDHNTGYHIFLTNREFYEFVWLPLAKQYDRSDVAGKVRRSSVELARGGDGRRLKASVDSGEYFLRSLPNLEPIPGVAADEGPFLEFVVQTLMHKGLPIPFDRIYSRDLQDRLLGFTRIQLSALRRTLHLLQLKDASVSPLYAEIMREETTQLLKSEYANFTQPEINRAILYIFSQLK